MRWTVTALFPQHLAVMLVVMLVVLLVVVLLVRQSLQKRVVVFAPTRPYWAWEMLGEGRRSDSMTGAKRVQEMQREEDRHRLGRRQRSEVLADAEL